MTNLIFVRHAESNNIVKEDRNRPLTRFGRLSAQELAIQCKAIDVDFFYSSPYIRALDTISPLADQKKKPIIIKENLREREIGAWVDDFQSYSQHQWSDFNYKLTLGESLLEVQQRYLGEIELILDKHNNKTIVLATHGTALCTLLNCYDNSVDYQYFVSIKHKCLIF